MSTRTSTLRFNASAVSSRRYRRLSGKARTRHSLTAAIVIVAMLALLSLGRQLAEAVDTFGHANAPVAGIEDIAFAEIDIAPAEPDAASLVGPRTVAMAHCHFFADLGERPYVCVAENLDGDRQRIAVFQPLPDSDRWAVAFEHTPDPAGALFRGMLPEDLNGDGVPELTTLWDTPTGAIVAHVICRDNGELVVVGGGPEGSLMPTVPLVTPGTRTEPPSEAFGVAVELPGGWLRTEADTASMQPVGTVTFPDFDPAPISAD